MNCDLCVYYVYDESEECSICMADFDEDEWVRMYSRNKDCPYFRAEDEYGIVRKQN